MPNDNKNIICKLTGSKGTGINAHIVPRSFYRFSKNAPNETRQIYPLHDGDRITRSPKGVYDKNIVTKEGESYFDACDDYASKFLIEKRVTGKEIKENGKVLGIEYPDYDYHLLKMFCMTLLWRSHVTTRQFFKNVDIGSHHEAKLREHILAKSSGELDDYTVMIGYYEDTHDCGFGVVSPWKTKLKGIYYYTFHLTFWVVYIKVSNQPFPQDIRDFAMERNTPLRAINLGPYAETNLYSDFVSPYILKRRS